MLKARDAWGEDDEPTAAKAPVKSVVPEVTEARRGAAPAASTAAAVDKMMPPMVLAAATAAMAETAATAVAASADHRSGYSWEMVRIRFLLPSPIPWASAASAELPRVTVGPQASRLIPIGLRTAILYGRSDLLLLVVNVERTDRSRWDRVSG